LPSHLADTLGKQARFAPVQAGEIVTTGTLTARQPVSPGETWATMLDGIDLPGLSITFARMPAPNEDARRIDHAGAGLAQDGHGISPSQPETA